MEAKGFGVQMWINFSTFVQTISYSCLVRISSSVPSAQRRGTLALGLLRIRVVISQQALAGTVLNKAEWYWLVHSESGNALVAMRFSLHFSEYRRELHLRFAVHG